VVRYILLQIDSAHVLDERIGEGDPAWRRAGSLGPHQRQKFICTPNLTMRAGRIAAGTSHVEPVVAPVVAP
jgi:hypothetical protein